VHKLLHVIVIRCNHSLSCILHLRLWDIIMVFIFLPCGFFFYLLLSSPNLSGRRVDTYHTSTQLPYFYHTFTLNANLEYMSEICCTQLAGNTGRKNNANNRHLGTIVQLCRAESSQLRHVSTMEKKLVKQQYLLHMSPQYGELRPISGRDRFVA